MTKKVLRTFRNFIYGLIFGFGSPVPGVSAGTMAILLNVYDNFFSIFSFDFAKKNAFQILIFFIGWIIGLAGISNIMLFLFENHGMITSFVFIGLIAGSVPMIYRKAAVTKIKKSGALVFIIALGFMIFLAVFGDDLEANPTIADLGGVTYTLIIRVFISSIFSSMAMLIPGVGGSLIMLVFGIYTIYIESIATLNIPLLITFITSMIIGVLLGIVLTKKALKHFAQALYCAILGFIIGSLLILYPGLTFDYMGIISILGALACFVFAYWLSGKEK